MLRQIILSCFGLWGCWSFQANAGTLILQGNIQQINPLSAVEIYKDPTGTLNIQQILQPAIQGRFATETSGHHGEINFGFTEATYWIKLRLQRTPLAPPDWVLEIPYLNLNEITLYAPDQPPTRVGTNFHADSKPIFYPLYALPLHVSTQPETFYLQVKSQYALTLPLMLWNRTAFSREFSDKLLSQALYFGGLLSLAIYNFLLFLSLRDRSYLYYTLFALALGMGMFAGNGYGRLYFWPAAETWDTVAQTTFFSLAGALSLMFTRSFLRTQEAAPTLNGLLKFFTIAYLVAAPLLAASIWTHLSPTSIFQFILIITLPAMLSMLFAGIRVYRSGNPSALYFLLACGSLWIGASAAALRAFDILPSNGLTLYALQIGSCGEMLLLSFALAHRIHTERDQRILAQQAVIEARNRLLTMSQENEALLENKVVERSKQLQEFALNEKKIRQQYVRFGAMIAHEFRNPLGIIETQSTLLQRERQLGIDKVDGRAETILGATHRLAKLFDQWLKSDQLQQPISQAYPTQLELGALMHPVIRAASGYHRDRVITMQPIPNEIILKGDQGLLEIALLNLIDNACKYSPPNEPVTVSFQSGEGRIGIVISDKGSGLPPELYDEIFKPYARTDDTKDKPGYGLGLAFVAHIAELHQGSIEVVSRLDKGSQFCLWIPCTS